ncbi:MAG: hypothetical protein HY238_07530 [Acidobacteria bacterium]|nr:hypothetical protein [Acidobacteriota bacterium]
MEVIIVAVGAVLVLAGIASIAYALGWGQRLSEKPVDIEIKKLDFHLQGTHLTLAMLLSLLLTAGGAGLLYKLYLSRLGGVQEELQKVRSELTGMKGSIDEVVKRFKFYDLKLHLVFPDQVDGRTVQIQAYRTKLGDLAGEACPSRKTLGEENTIWVDLDGLSSGDLVRIEAFDGVRKWVSTTAVQIPRTHVEMKTAN